MNVLLLLTALDSCLSVRAAFYIYIYIVCFLSFILLLLVDIIFLFPFIIVFDNYILYNVIILQCISYK